MTTATAPRKATNITWHEGNLPREERWKNLKATGCTMWFTGLSASGKSTIASALEQVLVQRGINSYRLDGDNIRHGLNSNLGFSAEDRDENVRRVGEVAALFADAGVIALVPLVSPYRAARAGVRRRVVDAGLRFVEVHVATPLEECERRDPKGLYARARAGELTGMTGIDDPYEAPERPELVLTPADGDPAAQAALVLELLEAG